MTNTWDTNILIWICHIHTFVQKSFQISLPYKLPMCICGITISNIFIIDLNTGVCCIVIAFHLLLLPLKFLHLQMKFLLMVCWMVTILTRVMMLPTLNPQHHHYNTNSTTFDSMLLMESLPPASVLSSSSYGQQYIFSNCNNDQYDQQKSGSGICVLSSSSFGGKQTIFFIIVKL